MKRGKVSIISILIVSFFLMSEKNSFSYGLGVDANYNFSFVKFNCMSKDYMWGAGFGLIYDSAPAKDMLFNYRLNINYTNYFHNASFHELKLYNIFGFGLIRNKIIKLFIGPILGLGYTGDFAYKNGDFSNLSIGAAIGMNFHLSKNVSLTVEFDYNVITVLGNQPAKAEDNEISSADYAGWDLNLFEGDLYHGGNIRIGFLFKINESI